MECVKFGLENLFLKTVIIYTLQFGDPGGANITHFTLTDPFMKYFFV